MWRNGLKMRYSGLYAEWNITLKQSKRTPAGIIMFWNTNDLLSPKVPKLFMQYGKRHPHPMRKEKDSLCIGYCLK